ncbi:MFS transporter [Rossellomorea marisflavi]|uniref:MFS transporter n=1 Tax=Rossellomorea marisflavi TaxID=189381 RepID=UPI003D281758
MMNKWKYPAILLTGIGIANIGDWIYLIALNLIVLNETQSPMAVVLLYLLKPAAGMVVNAWSGSLIDRVNKRNLMIILDLSRAVSIMVVVLMPVSIAMYAVVFFINMMSAVFEPASRTYMTQLIPKASRQRFNALKGLIGSGAFIMGPAIAGLLFQLGTPHLSLFVTAAALCGSGLITLLLPNLEREALADADIGRFSLQAVREDWKLVSTYTKRHAPIMLIYFLFSCLLVMTAAVDSLEAAFSKQVLHLSDSTYGYMVSIAGVGFILGSIVNTAFAHRLPYMKLMGGGGVAVAAGYLLYASSDTMVWAATGFAFLSFALAFASTGFETFFQEKIPVKMMGRIASIYGLAEGALVLIMTISIGIGAEFVSIRWAVCAGAIIMFITSILLLLSIRRESRPATYEIHRTGIE